VQKRSGFTTHGVAETAHQVGVEISVRQAIRAKSRSDAENSAENQSDVQSESSPEIQPQGQSDVQSERRTFARVFLQTRGQLLLQDGQKLPCLLHDVSVGGAFVSVPGANLGVGTLLTLFFAIGRKYEIDARILRVDASHRPHPGIGLEWVTPDEDSLDRLAMEIARIMVNRRRQQGR